MSFSLQNPPLVSRPALDALQPVFIVGTPKSGTTFLFSLLSSHPATITLLETAAYSFARRQKQRPAADGVAAADQHLTAYYPHIHPALDRDHFLALARDYFIPDRPGQSLLYALLATILPQADAAAVTHFVEKTPGHYRPKYIKAILADFPTARVLHTLRDPRDNYLSLKRRVHSPESLASQNPTYHPLNFLQNEVLAGLEAAYDHVARFGDRYRVVFYEDLVRHGPALMRDLGAWLGLAWDEALLTATLHGETWRGNSSAQDLRGQLDAFDPRPIGRWGETLAAREVVVLEYLIQAFGLAAQYPLTRPRTRQALARSLLAPFEEELRREALQRAGQPFLRRMPSLAWAYVRKRRALYLRLTRQARRADQRLVEHSFAPSGE